MDELKITGQIDILGRLGIPAKMRKLLGQSDKNGKLLVNMYTQDDKIIVERAVDTCVLCKKNTENLIDFKNVKICASCKEELTKF